MRIQADLRDVSEVSSQPVLPISGDQRLLNRFGNRRGMSPGSRANLSKPGQTNNPRGGATMSMVALLKQELQRIPSKRLDGQANAEGLSNAQLICQRIIEDSLEGNSTLLKDIIDRVDGKATQSISGPSGGPLEIRQKMEIINPRDLQPALAALIECGAVQINPN